MSDVFSLAPEGQAWIDDKTVANPARPEDYDPTPFQGSGTALLSGVAVSRSLPSDSASV